MKSIVSQALLAAALVLLANTSHANCLDRLDSAQSQIEAQLDTQLSGRQRSEIQQILFSLCEQRIPGSSVVDEPSRRIITTHGLNEREPVLTQETAPVVIGVDVDGRKPRRHDRPRARP